MRLPVPPLVCHLQTRQNHMHGQALQWASYDAVEWCGEAALRNAVATENHANPVSRVFFEQ